MKHSADELKQWQMLPLEIKERMSLTRIIGWIHEYGVEGVYEAFSGGKDSSVLSHLIHRALTQLGYEDVVPRVYANTGLEWPSVRLFAQKHPNVVTIRPSKTFREVIIQYGYPIIGKEVSDCIDSARKFIDDWEKKHKILTEQNRTEQNRTR